MQLRMEVKSAGFGALAALLVPLTVACGGSPNSPVESEDTVVDIRIEPPLVGFFALGDTAQLSVYRTTRSGASYIDPAPDWSIDDWATAVIDVEGRLVAVANGSTYVRATSAGLSAQSPVRVEQVPDSIILPPVTTVVGVDRVVEVGATVVDARGNELQAPPAVAWSVGSPSIIALDGPGRIRGLAPDTTTLVAAVGSARGSVGVWVAETHWPNEPAGLTTLSDQPFDELKSFGWGQVNRHQGQSVIVSDATAPMSPGNVLEFQYPAGFEGGSAPAVSYISSGGADAVYLGFWMKVDPNWTGHPTGSQKIAFVRNAGGDEHQFDNLFMMMRPAAKDGFAGTIEGGPYRLAVANNGGGHSHLPDPILPNAGTLADATIVPGQWHRVEWLVDRTNGRMQWWLDGALVGDYQGVEFDGAFGFGEITLTPVWGGLGSTKPKDEWWRFDHAYVSVRR